MSEYIKYLSFLKNPKSLEELWLVQHWLEIAPASSSNNMQKFFIRPANQHEIDNSAQAYANGRTTKSSPPEYKVDRYGFRIASGFAGLDTIDDSDHLHIGFFGCSFTYGIGLESEEIWIEGVASALSVQLNRPVTIYNFGEGGAGVQRIADIFRQVTQFRKLDYAFFLLPDHQRYQYPVIVTDHQPTTSPVKLINVVNGFNPTRISNEQQYQLITRNKSMSELDDVNRLINELQIIELIAKVNNVKIFYSAWRAPTYEILSTHIDNSAMLPFFGSSPGTSRDGNWTDFAADGSHPGPKLNQHWVNIVQQYFIEHRKGLD